MPEYIDRDIAVKAVMAAKWESGSDGAVAMEIVAASPAVDVEPVRHGRWEKGDQFPGWLCCSACRDAFVLPEWVNRNKWKFCPNCGAKMDEGVET